MEEICSFEMLVNFYRTTRRHSPEGSTPHGNHCEDPMPDTGYMLIVPSQYQMSNVNGELFTTVARSND
jgi:hypothetical protein